jgi:hypothetical protein
MSRASLPPVEIGAAARTTGSAGEQGRPGRPLSRRGRVPRDPHEPTNFAPSRDGDGRRIWFYQKVSTP